VGDNGSLTTLVLFDGDNGWCQSHGSAGPDGSFFGTTSGGGSDGYGSVFQVDQRNVDYPGFFHGREWLRLAGLVGARMAICTDTNSRVAQVVAERFSD
jgi:uncharacterized repeat protein (TIGR03803 family)